MANRIVSVHAGIYGMGIYAIMLPSSGFSVAHFIHIIFCECLHYIGVLSGGISGDVIYIQILVMKNIYKFP